MRTVIPTVAAGLWLAAAAAPQTVWIVDSQQRQGFHFADLPQAVAAVRPGDVLRVRNGIYTTFTTNKGIAVLADTNACFGLVTNVPVRVRDIPAGQRFVMAGMRFTFAGAPTLIEVTRCAGLVSIEDLSAPAIIDPAIVVDTCRNVSVTGGVVQGTPPLRVTNSAIHLADVHLRSTLSTTPVPAVQLVSSIAYLSRCRVEGGQTGPFHSAPAMDAIDSRVVVTGDGGAGYFGGAFLTPGPVFTGLRTTLTIHPIVPIVPSFGGSPFGPGLRVVHDPVPSLRVSAAAPGGAVAVDLFAGSGDLAILLVGASSAPLRVPGFTDVFVDPSRHAVAASALLNTARQQWRVIVPNLPTLLGAPLTWQAVSGRAPVVRATNPATRTLR